MQQFVFFSSVQLLSCVQHFASLWTASRQAPLSITNFQSLLKLMFIESVMPSNQLILFCPLLLLPSIFLNISVFSNESALRVRWPKYWRFSFNISPANEHAELISFRMDWLDLLTVQGTFKSLLQHHSSKASILLCSAFFIVQLSHPYMTTGKTIQSQVPLTKVLILLKQWGKLVLATSHSWTNGFANAPPSCFVPCHTLFLRLLEHWISIEFSSHPHGSSS